MPQVDQLLQKYPELYIIQMNESLVSLGGTIFVCRVANDFPVRHRYSVEIRIPLNTDQLPYVIDIGQHINNYQHYYSNGTLCLATDSQIRLRFIDGFDLIAWMEEFVETYFFSYEYYRCYGSFPFGDRAHGQRGVIQTYQDIFKTDDLRSTLKLMAHIMISPYRGHQLCPCASGKRVRDCHGPVILPFYSDARYRSILESDFINCINEPKEGGTSGANSNTAKRRYYASDTIFCPLLL